MTTLAVYFNESEYFIGTSPEQAECDMINVFGTDYPFVEDGEEPIPFQALPMDTKLILWVEDGKVSDGGNPVEKTCAEWIEFNGPGYLASVDF